MTARACVSPLVKRAEPWVLGRTETSQVIGLMSSGVLPSILFPVATRLVPHRLLGDLVDGLADDLLVYVRVGLEAGVRRLPSAFSPRSSLVFMAKAASRSCSMAARISLP